MEKGLFIVLRRYDKRGRDWCSGIMRTAVDRLGCRLRLIETDDSGRVDFGVARPAGVFAYLTPEKAVRAALKRSEAGTAPVIAFPCEPSEAGFGSVSRLKAIFHKRYGMSMRDWRKQYCGHEDT